MPVEKVAGMQATGGTLNTSGSFTLRVTHTGADTMLARIIRMVEAAQGARRYRRWWTASPAGSCRP